MLGFFYPENLAALNTDAKFKNKTNRERERERGVDSDSVQFISEVVEVEEADGKVIDVWKTTGRSEVDVPRRCHH